MTGEAPREPAPGGADDFREVFGEYFPRLLAYFRAAGFDRFDAEDLSQRVLLNVYRQREQYRGEGSLAAWVYAAARNAARDEWRRRGRSPASAELPESTTDSRAAPDDAAAGRQEAGRAVRALRELPARMRACLLLQVREELSYEEIAGRLGLSPRTVKVQIWNARRRLRELLGERP